MNDEDVHAWAETTERLQFTVRKLAGHAGWDISELIEEGWLKEGDMD